MMKVNWESMTKEEHAVAAEKCDHPLCWPRAWHHREHVDANARTTTREIIVQYGRVQSPTPNT